MNARSRTWQDWEIPREAIACVARPRQEAPPRMVGGAHARQKDIDASIAAKAEFEYLYDKPYADKRRSASPALSPSRIQPPSRLRVDENDELIDGPKEMIRIRGQEIVPRNDPENLKDRRRAAGPQGRPDRFHCAHALARRSRLRRRPLHGWRHREARRHLHRPGVRNCPAR